MTLKGFPCGPDSKESAASVGNLGSIPELGRSPGGEHGNPLHYSCLESLMDRGVGGLQSMGPQRVGYVLATEHGRAHTHTSLTLSKSICKLFAGMATILTCLVLPHN